MFDLARAFEPDGLLAQNLPGYAPRQAQLEMAQAIQKTIANKGALVAEAGTGTGKTFAYLLPAIVSGERVIISTGTKNLQDQLFHKDLPLVRKALGVPVNAALLKGRNNYLCLYRLDTAGGFRAGYGRVEAAALQSIGRWSSYTADGDVAEVTDVAETSPVWPAVTSTADNCLGQDCPRYGDCFLVKARRRAQDARIVVINHHLLWADWLLKNDGFGELLPDAGAIIVDEAHQFAETATQFLGLSVTSRQLNDLADDIVVEQIKDARDQADLADQAEKLEHLIAELRLVLGADGRREAWSAVEGQVEIRQAIDDLRLQLENLTISLKAAAVRGKGLESCWKRCGDLDNALSEFLADEDGNSVRWFEVFKRSFSFNRTPLEIAGAFAKFHRSSGAAWVFTSATLSVSAKFDHFARTLGLDDAETRRWDSPFDYAAQSMLFVPPDMPDPSAPGYTQAVVDIAVPVLEASRGRAFMLFTSHKAMQEAAEALPSRIGFPLFVQGEQPKAALLEAFRQAGNGVLLGTASFWEGVDVRGPELSCVIIDKLPFASPGDPVLSARLDALKQRGQNPFSAHQLPAAVIALKQGVGRLIRAHDDSGVLMLCDPRLLNRSYGKVFLNSLPPMRRTRMLGKVQAFFAPATESKPKTVECP